MKSNEFLSLAIRLANSDDEADLRTSVSRSYYGAYHAAIEFLDECGVRLPPSVDSQKKVRWCLDEARHVAASLASRHLDSLRSDWNEADYDLRSRRFCDRANIALSLQGAGDVIDAIGACKSDSDLQWREHVRKYAKEVLRLSVGEA